MWVEVFITLGSVCLYVYLFLSLLVPAEKGFGPPIALLKKQTKTKTTEKTLLVIFPLKAKPSAYASVLYP